jgi:hypothetical protein
MSREPQGKASKGSQKWIQVLVNEHCEVISQKLAESHGLGHIRWLSPLKEDDYSEYRDRSFIDRLDVDLDVPLKSFWSAQGGPRWDALGKAKAGHGEIIIVEAKSHTGEMVSGGSKAKSEKSKQIYLDNTVYGFIDMESVCYKWQKVLWLLAGSITGTHCCVRDGSSRFSVI